MASVWIRSVYDLSEYSSEWFGKLVLPVVEPILNNSRNNLVAFGIHLNNQFGMGSGNLFEKIERPTWPERNLSGHIWKQIDQFEKPTF